MGQETPCLDGYAALLFGGMGRVGNVVEIVIAVVAGFAILIIVVRSVARAGFSGSLHSYVWPATWPGCEGARVPISTLQ